MSGRTASFSLLSGLALVLARLFVEHAKTPEENPNKFPTRLQRRNLNTLTQFARRSDQYSWCLHQRSGYYGGSGTEDRYTVCVRSDSRDASKQYTGSKDRIAFFYDGISIN